MTSPLLTVSHLRKSYAAAVLDDVNLDLAAGEVHALIGENGAGKTTFARILAGLTRADAGELRLAGQAFAPRNRTEAVRAGVRLVMQELNLIGNLTVAENLFFDRLPHHFGWIDDQRLHLAARAALAMVGLEALEPGRLTRSLGIGQQQLVEIAAGLSQHCRVLILDEPTAALSGPEIDHLFAQVARLKADGVGIIYISHRLEELERIADRITVLRDGKIVGTGSMPAMDRAQIIRLMVGRELPTAGRRAPGSTRPTALRVVGLRAGAAVRDVSFTAHYGEILGFAGLMGSGRTETMRAIFGADPLEAGQIFLDGSPSPVAIRTPHEAVRHGIALLTEDRKEQGLLLPLPVRANLTLANLRPLARHAGWIRPAAERSAAEHWTKRLNVRCASVEQPVAELSGGNQQKVVIAKWLHRDGRILIFDEPTRGIDVGTKFEVYRLLDQLAEQGKAVLVVSSDLEELMSISDRIAVMSAGRIAMILAHNDWTREQIMAAAVSGCRSAAGERSCPLP